MPPWLEPLLVIPHPPLLRVGPGKPGHRGMGCCWQRRIMPSASSSLLASGFSSLDVVYGPTASPTASLPLPRRTDLGLREEG